MVRREWTKGESAEFDRKGACRCVWPRERPSSSARDGSTRTRLLSSPGSWLPAAVGFGIPFLLIFTLAVEAGGYEVVLRSQVGIIVWWGVLFGLLAGLLPMARISRQGWFALAAFGGLIFITAVATLTWTESAERSVIEFSRTLTIFGAFVLLLMIQGKEGLRRTLAAIAVATALVATVALVDRFDPGLLPFGASQLLPENYPRARLNFPIEYWNGLAAMMAIGLGPLLWLVGSARDNLSRALAAGAVPLVVLATYMTASRGGTASAVLGVLILILLYPERLKLAVAAIIPALGSVMLIVMVNSRPEIRDLILGDTASSQGIEMLWLCVAVVLFVSIMQFSAVALLERSHAALPEVRPRTTWMVGSVLAGLISAMILAGLLTGFFSDRWADFKEPVGQGTVNRLSTVNSSERYLVWDSALDAAASEKLTGIGPGTFEYWWAREGTGIQFMRDAHSLYLEALAEMGPLAFLLVLLLVLGPIFYAFRLSLRLGRDHSRAPLAAAAAGMVAFSVAAGVDWAWEITVLPVAFFALVAAVLGSEMSSAARRRAETDANEQASLATKGQPSDLRVRLPAAAAALPAIAIIAVPMVGSQALESSQKLVRNGDLDAALSKTRRAVDLQPWAASPRVQEAQVLELLGRHRDAVVAAREAIDRERGNWRNWLVLSQLLRKSSPQRAELALERARSLNSKSTLPELGAPGLDGDRNRLNPRIESNSQ